MSCFTFRLLLCPYAFKRRRESNKDTSNTKHQFSYTINRHFRHQALCVDTSGVVYNISSHVYLLTNTQHTYGDKTKHKLTNLSNIGGLSLMSRILIFKLQTSARGGRPLSVALTVT